MKSKAMESKAVRVEHWFAGAEAEATLFAVRFYYGPEVDLDATDTEDAEREQAWMTALTHNAGVHSCRRVTHGAYPGHAEADVTWEWDMPGYSNGRPIR